MSKPKEKRKSAAEQEADFLAEQSRLAKEALQTVLGEMKRNLARSADVRAWAERYPWPMAATAAGVGVGAGMAVKSVISGKSTNGHAPLPAEERIPALHVEVRAKEQAKKKPAAIVRGLRWLVTGLATAIAEALFAATRKNVETALKHQQNGHAEQPTIPAT